MSNKNKEKLLAAGVLASVVVLFAVLMLGSVTIPMVLGGIAAVLALATAVSRVNRIEDDDNTNCKPKRSGRPFRRMAAVMAVVCLLASLSLSVLAADPDQLIIGNQTIDKITITGDNDGITSTNNSYEITAKDSSASSTCGGTTYTGRPRTMTFTNNYNGWIEITYTISGAGSTGGSAKVEAGTNCTVENGVITLNAKDSTFTIVVQSSSNSGADSEGSYIATFAPTKIEYEELTPLISFAAPAAEQGSFTVKDKNGTAVAVPGSAESSSYTLTATAKTGYQIYRWVFTNSSGTVSYFGDKTNSVTYTASEPGTITCQFMPTGAATYTVGSNEYIFLDEAITAAGSSGTIVLTGNGTVYGSEGQKSFTIPSGVKMVLPYAAGATTVQSSSAKFPYANYAEASLSDGNWYQNPSTPAQTIYLKIPSGTTVINNGTIAVGGTQAGNAATYGAHANLVVDGNLQLGSGVLSACGYVTGNGTVTATGNGAKIYQPLALIRIDSDGWVQGTVNGKMATYASDEYGTYNSANPSPRYVTQNIQCDLEMKYGDTMYGYMCQVNSSTWYRTTVTLVGSYSSSNTNMLIRLKEGATLTSEYDANAKSSTYSTIGKQTVTINGNAEQGMLSASVGVTLNLSKWPFPVPYNYDIILASGSHKMNYDTNFLPGSGLKVESGATLDIASGVELAMFTGAFDYSILPPRDAADGTDPVAIMNDSGSLTTNTGRYGTAGTGAKRYPQISTMTAGVTDLNGVTAGSKMGNLVVNGTLNVLSGGAFGGVVQTNGGGTVVMADGANVGIFTKFLGMTGTITSSTPYAHAGLTVYKFQPQYFDASGTLQNMEANKTYYGKDAQNSIPNITFDLYYTSADTTAKYTPTKAINATAVGQWSDTACEHDWSAATCTTPKTCTLCGATEGETAAHTEVTVTGKAATCTATGLTDGKKCSVCGTVTVPQTTIAKLAHTEETIPGKAATCTETGLTEGKKCSVCGTVTVAQTTIPASGHNYESVVTAPTCSAGGFTTNTCGNCGDSYVSGETEATGCSYDAVVTAPTCTAAGYTTYTCSVCGDSYVDDEVPALGHKEETVAGKAATCTETGLTDGAKCSVCGEVLEAQEEIPALGHTEATREENREEATCGKDGSYDLVTYCSVCDTVIETETKTIAATGNHVFTDYQDIGGDLERAECANNCGATDTRVKENSGADVEVIPEEKDNGKKHEADIGMGVLNQILDGKQTLNLNSKVLDLVFNEEAVGTIIEKHTGSSTISLVVEDMTEEEDCLVFDLYLSVDGKKQESTDFGGKNVTVTIPLDQYGNLVGKKVTVQYLPEGRDPEEMESVLDRDGMSVQFVTSHFSVYTVLVEDCDHDWGSGVETVPPTAAEEGVKTYTCGICGETKTEVIPATGPIYVENATFNSVGMVLKDYIGLQLAISKSKLNGGNYDKAYYDYVQRTPDGVESFGSVDFHLEQGSFVGAEIPVLAWSMSDEFTVTVYFEKDGIVYQGQTVTTSIREQAMNRINAGTTTDKIRALCVGMLNYGAAVQDYFNHSDAEMSYLANYELTTEQKTLPQFSELALSGDITIPDGLLKPESKGLSAREKINLQFAIKNKDLSSYEVRYTIGGVEQEPIQSDDFMVQTAGNAVYSGPSIAMTPMNMRSEVVLGFYDVETGERVYGDIICSVAAFAKGNEGKPTEQLTIALMVYGDAAAAQFNN